MSEKEDLEYELELAHGRPDREDELRQRLAGLETAVPEPVENAVAPIPVETAVTAPPETA